ncbi:hypothetical protein T07_2319 [Trichinella nelsoni]|uniref:Uncharacterized protein n=1 Tax=Trichinella nelsoni TaxID=6336 RepID=A0A0V0RI99_9BILA|nr:hypothetical protein T07_2319 [Trichinella nelsoni]
MTQRHPAPNRGSRGTSQPVRTPGIRHESATDSNFKTAMEFHAGTVTAPLAHFSFLFYQFNSVQFKVSSIGGWSLWTLVAE